MFSKLYTIGRRRYNARDYAGALEALREARKEAVSEFAKGDCDWWIGMCQSRVESKKEAR